jgi:hypothetical protein
MTGRPSSTLLGSIVACATRHSSAASYSLTAAAKRRNRYDLAATFFAHERGDVGCQTMVLNQARVSCDRQAAELIKHAMSSSRALEAVRLLPRPTLTTGIPDNTAWLRAASAASLKRPQGAIPSPTNPASGACSKLSAMRDRISTSLAGPREPSSTAASPLNCCASLMMLTLGIAVGSRAPLAL